MEDRIPRVILAGTMSGCGKTTVTCAVLGALRRRGLGVGAFKCGPDYIDPMFHARITGSPGCNLDLEFFKDDTARYLLASRGAGRDVCVIEGVMGYYDGAGPAEKRASTWDVARATDTPAVLVVNARGAALSLLAVIEGFRSFVPESRVRGVILNGCSPGVYGALAQAVRERFRGEVVPLGYLPRMPDCSLESRHLGLVTAREVPDLDGKVEALARRAEETLDLDGLLALASQAPPLSCTPPEIPRLPEPVRIAVAEDEAFCFYYAENLDLLREMGAQLVPFSPLSDAALPEGIDGLYLGGGYPELHAKALSGNASMLASVRDAVTRGLPTVAECGGFMYLTRAIGDEPMAGVLPGRCFDAGKLVRFGYVSLTAGRENLLCREGGVLKAHEFHRWDCTEPGASFAARKASGAAWDCAQAFPRLYAGFPHFHFYSDVRMAARFCETCLEVKRAHVR